MLAAGPRSVADDGSSLLVRPDEFEHRTYQLLRADVDGGSHEVGALALETVRQIAARPDARLILARTHESLYLFRDGKKARFMPETRAQYVDCALATDTGWFIAAYCDPLGSAHSLAFGDASGRVGWTRECPEPVAAVGISADGSRIAMATTDGDLEILDPMRQVQARVALGSPVTALCMGKAGCELVVGLQSEELVRVDNAGRLTWRMPISGIALSIAGGDHFERIAVGLRTGESEFAILILDSSGVCRWESPCAIEPRGAASSPAGRHFVFSFANGEARCLEWDPVAEPEPESAPEQLVAARSLAAAGKLAEALHHGIAHLNAHPTDMDAAEWLLDLRDRLVSELCDQARAFEASGRPGAALESARAALAWAPLSVGMFEVTVRLRIAAERLRVTEARELASAGEFAAAHAIYLELLTADPFRTDLRSELDAVRAAWSRAQVTDAEVRLSRGLPEEALTLWRSAYQLHPTAALEARIRVAEIDRMLTSARHLYEADRMTEAAFQFRRILGLDPTHAEARRYLGYAEGRTSDGGLQDRFSRLE